ncbi:Serine-threonine/tyrosine-protein kinase [Theobroma cacao]|nr:Serine-threonine/tyrosine-protein kinase [Theobroma cacao]
MADVIDHQGATSSENSKDSGDRPEKNSENEVVQARHRRQGAIISSYASACELRVLNKENEKKDGSSPKGVLEACLEGLESNIISYVDSPKAEIRCTNGGALANWRKFFKLWKRRSRKHLAAFTPLAVPKLSRKNSRSTKENPVLRDLYNFKSSLEDFSLPELRAATDNFSQENLIGKGGYAEVYKGRLKDGKLVAIKRLIKGTPDERTAGFLSELGIIAHVNHPNTATLIGCGIDGGMHLVFQLSPLGSLGSVLHADLSSRFAILALPSGYQNNGLTTMYQNLKELSDPSLGDDYDAEEVDRMVLTASLCIEQSPILRPQMSQVVILLRGDEYVAADCAKEPHRRSIQRTYSNELLDAQEYNSTKHLNNINRLREIALGS